MVLGLGFINMPDSEGVSEVLSGDGRVSVDKVCGLIKHLESFKETEDPNPNW